MSILDGVGDGVKRRPDQDFEAEDEVFGTDFPGLYEFLARILVKGEPRKPGKLIIYYDAGKAGICLSDAHTGSCAFHVDSGIMEALEGVERRLQAHQMDWRVDKRRRL